MNYCSYYIKCYQMCSASFGIHAMVSDNKEITDATLG